MQGFRRRNEDDSGHSGVVGKGGIAPALPTEVYGMLPEIVRESIQRIVDKTALTCCSLSRM